MTYPVSRTATCGGCAVAGVGSVRELESARIDNARAKTPEERVICEPSCLWDINRDSQNVSEKSGEGLFHDEILGSKITYDHGNLISGFDILTRVCK